MRRNHGDTRSLPKQSIIEPKFKTHQIQHATIHAQAAQAQEVKALIDKLEEEARPVKLTWVAAGQVQCGMDLLDGVWRLLYSSAFESGNLGGSRPGPPAELAPLKLVRSSCLLALAPLFPM